MSASQIDSGYASPLHEADRRADATPEIAAGNETQPKARTRRPRPTFDDGSVTRCSKFPSKTYPRCSYYVTSTEVIIRIKKARRKWKLIVPKKRMVATNRWFAKPRWVEIELTYTQAVKLGLVEPRKDSPDITSGTSAQQQAATQSIVDGGHLTGSGSEPEPDSTSTRQFFVELNPTVEHLEEDADADVRSGQSKFALAAARPHTDSAAPRGSATLVTALSVLLLLSGVAAWVKLSGSSSDPMTAELACALSEQSSPCARTIVTGAIGKSEQLQSREPEPSATFATHASSEPMHAIEQLQPGAPDIATTRTEREDEAARVVNREDSTNEGTGTVTAAAEIDKSPAATTPKASLQVPQNVLTDRHDCGELGAASQSIHIAFDYASSGLKQTALPALESFAVRLRSCPSAKVIVEGHTDSDGRAARNQSLSVRRAKAVLEHLVQAGVPPSQLTAIGFGQLRPYAPNVSTENKRSNRRVALVVDVPRRAMPER